MKSSRLNTTRNDNNNNNQMHYEQATKNVFGCFLFVLCNFCFHAVTSHCSYTPIKMFTNGVLHANLHEIHNENSSSGYLFEWIIITFIACMLSEWYMIITSPDWQRRKKKLHTFTAAVPLNDYTHINNLLCDLGKCLLLWEIVKICFSFNAELWNMWLFIESWLPASQPTIKMEIWIAIYEKLRSISIEMRTTMMMFYMLKQSFQFKQAINFDKHKRICSMAYDTTPSLIQHS